MLCVKGMGQQAGILVVPFRCTILRCFWKSRMRIRLVRGGRPLIRTSRLYKFGNPIPLRMEYFLPYHHGDEDTIGFVSFFNA